mgnify:CR=1 FL=1
MFEADVRRPLETLLAETTEVFGGAVKIFRQHRDIRFSKDKSPYKLNTYGVVAGIPGSHAGLYASVSADRFVAGTG